LKVSQDSVESEGEMTLHVFEENEPRSNKADSFGNCGPKVSRVSDAELKSGLTERLARISGRQDVHFAVKVAVWERLNIRPNRGRIKLPAFHTRRQDAAGKLIDFRISDCASTSQHSFEPQVNAAVTGTETEMRDFGIIHIIFSWVKNLGVKSGGANQKRTNCAGRRPATEILWGKSVRVKRPGVNRPG
jgi:hypothetical protein